MKQKGNKMNNEKETTIDELRQQQFRLEEEQEELIFAKKRYIEESEREEEEALLRTQRLNEFLNTSDDVCDNKLIELIEDTQHTILSIKQNSYRRVCNLDNIVEKEYQKISDLYDEISNKLKDESNKGNTKKGK